MINITLVARGKSAIRSLKLILLNISNIENRTKDYISRLDSENKEYKLIKSNFEEVIEKCNILEEEIISSIENWTDIIPEVENIKTQIGLISDMKIREVELKNDISDLSGKITAITKEGSQLKDELLEKLTAKENELAQTKEKLKKAEISVNESILSGLTSTQSASGFNVLTLGNPVKNYYKRCTKCGKGFLTDFNNTTSLCPECTGSGAIGPTGVIITK